MVSSLDVDAASTDIADIIWLGANGIATNNIIMLPTSTERAKTPSFTMAVFVGQAADAFFEGNTITNLGANDISFDTTSVGGIAIGNVVNGVTTPVDNTTIIEAMNREMQFNTAYAKAASNHICTDTVNKSSYVLSPMVNDTIEYLTIFCVNASDVPQGSNYGILYGNNIDSYYSANPEVTSIQLYHDIITGTLYTRDVTNSGNYGTWSVNGTDGYYASIDNQAFLGLN